MSRRSYEERTDGGGSMPQKSEKRRKLESMVFSQSIRDIEKMLSINTTESPELKSESKTEPKTELRAELKAELKSLTEKTSSTPTEDLSASSCGFDSSCSQYVPTTLTSQYPQYKYDCINIAFLTPHEPRYEPRTSHIYAANPSKFETWNMVPQLPVTQWLVPAHRSVPCETKFLDWDLQDDCRDSDLPRVNLEKDLLLMDQLIKTRGQRCI